MVNIQEIAKRIKDFRESQGKTQEMFAESIGTTRSILSQVEICKLQPSIEMLASISSIYKVDYAFLIDGKKVTPNLTPIVTPKGKNKVNEPELPYQRNPSVITLDKMGNDNIVLVDVKAAASYLQHYQEPSFYKKLPVFSLPGAEYRNGLYRSFQVKGDSMHDTLFNGDIVAGKFVDDFLKIREGYIHVVVTKEDVVVKRCLNRIQKRGKLVLLSDNPDYLPYEVAVEDVLELWDVKAAIIASFPNRKKDFGKLIGNLQADMVEMSDRLAKLEAKK